jgi:hypothetical protein
LVILPEIVRFMDVPCLRALIAADQKDDHVRAITAKINPIPGSPGDLQLENALADRPPVAGISFSKPFQPVVKDGTSFGVLKP